MARAIPKSRTLTCPAGPTMTFPGLTSRWTMPRSWAKARASATSAAIRIDRSKARGPSRHTTLDSGSPSISSMTRNGVWLSIPTS